MNKQKLSSRDSRGLRERGQVILMVGLATLVMFGIVGLAVDVGRLYVTRVELGRAVDAAALSGILEFNGTLPGLGAAEDKAEWYFDQNEPGTGVTRVAWANPAANEMTMDATKSIGMIFLSVLGIHNASVSAHAKAGFGTQYLDAVMVLDATPSMAGNPIQQAVDAAGIFKDIMLGTGPTGNVKVGVTAFRGCFKPTPGPHTDCINTGTQTEFLSYNHSDLDATLLAIEGVTGGGSVGTNVCTGLAMGYNIVSGPGNHNNDVTYPGNKQYMILLSDGDNYYPGENTYAPPYYTSGSYNTASSPTGTTVASTVYPCQPIDSAAGSVGSACPAPWNNPAISSTYPCYKGEATPPFTISDNMDSSTWGGGSGWLASTWTVTGTASKTTSSTPQGTRHVLLGRGASVPSSYGEITRTIDFTNKSGSISYAAKRNSGFSGSDEAVVDVQCGGTWYVINTHRSSSTGGYAQVNDTGYLTFNKPLPPECDNQNPITLRVRITSMSATTDQFFFDTVQVSGGTSNTDGYLNGNDNSNPANCDSNQTPRERQLDVRTINLAQAIKAEGVEIFVVAFAGGVPNCHLDYPSLFYDDDNPAHCGTVVQNTSYPIGQSGIDGDNPKPATNPNVRLLKCIASSTNGTDDHYFYASSASELQAIFTAIANQIAHRLIE